MDHRRGEGEVQQGHRQALSSGPRAITKHGRAAVVVVSAEDWERKTHRPGNLAEFFAESPLRGSGLTAPRMKDGPRKIRLMNPWSKD